MNRKVKDIISLVFSTLIMLYVLTYSIFTYIDLSQNPITNVVDFVFSFSLSGTIDLGDYQIKMDRPFWIIEQGADEDHEYVDISISEGTMSIFVVKWDTSPAKARNGLINSMRNGGYKDIANILYETSCGDDNVYIHFNFKDFNISRGFSYSYEICFPQSELRVLIQTDKLDVYDIFNFIDSVFFSNSETKLKVDNIYWAGDNL